MEKIIMNNVTTRLVTPTRLRQILDCYGSSPSHWPEEERQAALSLLNRSSEFNQWFEQARSLDRQLKDIKALDNSAVDSHSVQSLQQRIMSELPEQELSPDQNTPADNTAPENQTDDARSGRAQRPRVWIGSIAASLFVVSLSAGVVYQLFAPGHDPFDQQTGGVTSHAVNNRVSHRVNNDFARWAWEDVTGESLAPDTDNEPTTLLALVDMEFSAE
jgi:hypothetical protein